MSRPKLTILLDYTNRNYISEQVLQAEVVYAVFYQNWPISLRSLNILVDYPPKYERTCFPLPGYAFNLARRLNRLFKTDEFSVYKLSGGEKVDRET